MSRHKIPPRVTHALAARHEALWLRLAALQAQVMAVALRRPRAPVSAQSARVAEMLLREAGPFLVPGAVPPPAAADYGGLCTQLGQAIAGLEAWEAVNSQWHSGLMAYVWLVQGQAPLPVRRLRPRLAGPEAPHADPAYAAYKARMADLRQKLVRRFEQSAR